MSTKSIPQKSPKSKPAPHFTLQEQRSKWVARFKLPDGFRAAFTVGPTAGPDRMTEERARETLRSFFERGLVDRLMAERTRETKAPKALTLGDVADKWATLIAKDTKLAPSTRAGHRLAAEGIITERFGDVEPKDLSPAMLRAWLRDLSHLSASRTRNVFFSLSKMIDDAIAEGWIALPLNPCRTREVQRTIPALVIPSDEEKAHHSPEEVRRILGCEHIPTERRVRYALAFGTGLRDGELAGLRWSDLVDVHGVPCVWVRGALQLVGENGIERGKTKTRASVRKVPLAPALVDLLKAWRSSGWDAFVGRSPESDDPILPDVHGKPSRPLSAALFRDDLVCAGLSETFEGKPFEFRSTRRTFTTTLASLGVDGELVDRLLGHAATSVRARNYTAGSTPEMFARLHAAVARLGNAFWQHAPPARFERTTFGLGIQKDQPEGLTFAANPGVEGAANNPSTHSQVPVATGVASVEEALAEALQQATRAAEWALVSQLARELEARRLEAAGNVVPMTKGGAR